MNEQAIETNSRTINGIDTDHVTSLAGKIMEDEDYGRFQFRAENRWINGARSRSRIKDFYAGKRDQTGRAQAMFVDADQPDFLGGSNTAPNSVEHLLHALTSCLTTTLTYHASVQGIAIDSIRTYATGELNSRGFFGLSDEVKKGYESIKVSMRVASEVNPETLTELAMNSPVYEMVSKAVPTGFTLVTV